MKLAKRISSAYFLVLLTAVMVCISPLTISGQEVNPGTQTGLPPFGSFAGSNFDHVNLLNGSLHIEIPILTVQERGRKLSWTFLYNTPTWQMSWFFTPQPHNPYAGVYRVDGPTDVEGAVNLNLGDAWFLSNPLSWGAHGVVTQSTCTSGANNGKPDQFTTEYVIVDPQGTQHQLPLRSETLFCFGSTSSGPTLDGSGAIYNKTTGTVTLKDGTQITSAAGSLTMQDANGNLASVNTSTGSVTDMYGRQLITVTQGPQTTYSTPLGKSVGGPSYTLFQVWDSTGTQQTYRVDYQALDFQTSMCAGVRFTCSETSGTVLYQKQLTLPNGKAYIFSYSNNGYLDLTGITLPTGATISYTLNGPARQWPQPSAPHAQPTFVGPRSVLTRAVSANGSNFQWSYSGIGTAGEVTTVTLPTGDSEVHSFGGVNVGVGTGGQASSPEQVEMSVVYKNSAGAVLKTVTTDWTGTVDPINGGVKSLQPIRKTVTLDNGLVMKKETDYETFQYACIATTCPGTTTRLNETELREYDYGSGAPGALLRRTDYTYLHNTSNGSTYLNLNIVDRVASVITYDSSGSQVSKTTTEYDNYTAGITTSGAIQHNSSFNASYLTRGNLTATNRWRNTDGVMLLMRQQYDDVGNVVSSTDSNNNQTKFDYTDSWTTQTGGNTCAPSSGQTKGYLTKVTNALNQTRTHSFFSCTGLPGSSTDSNSLTTTQTYDLFERPLVTTGPEGSQTTNTYDDTNLLVTTSKLIQTGRSAYTLDHFDQVGQHIEHDLCEDGTSACSSPIAATFAYDGLGRVYTQSNPFRSGASPSDGTTTYFYDALGRTCLVVPPDGTLPTGNTCPATQPANTVFTTYFGNTTTVTDQAGKSRKSVTDGLGRITQTFEDPGSSPHLNYETDYTYDALDNLLSVNQKGGDANSTNWRARSFVYNSLSQLTSSTNPESNTQPVSPFTLVPTNYSYDSNGNLLSKTSPAPNQTGTATVTVSYCYDALNRVTSKAYTAQSCPMSSPVAKYIYDGGAAPPGCTLPSLTVHNGIGRRTGMCDAAGSEAWSYDITANVGWMTTDARTTNGMTKSTIIQNNFIGSPATLAYPSTRVITYSYDAAARPLSAVDNTGPINYATAALYAPTGALSSFTNGASLVSTLYYNSRLQPCRISVKNTGTAPSSCTDTANIGGILDFTYGFNLGSADNGNVAGITNNRDNTRSQNFTYDALNRIATAQTQTTGVTIPNSNCWGLTFGYDPWGNLLQSSTTGPAGCGEPLPLNVTVTTANRISGYCYDSAGNLLDQATCPNPPHAYVYDAENHLTATAGVTYTYDGDGKRIQKSSGKLYWYGTGRDALDETDLTGSITNSSFKEYVFFGGKRIASRDYQNNVNYYFADHLGTSRVVSNSSGTILDDSDFYPFGGERPACEPNGAPGCTLPPGSGNSYKFTGKERDSETGLDNFGARYNSSSFGRFMSPDWTPGPTPVPYASPDHPQSLNLYSYVQNNPVSRTDPDGHCNVDGEHHWGWCIWHDLGFYETKNEYAARVASERQWLILNGLHDSPIFHKPFDPRTAPASVVDEQYQLWKQWEYTVGSSIASVYYRGGKFFDPKPGEVRLDENGNVKPTRGVSVNTEAEAVERFGGAYKIKSIPDELKIIQRGANPNHFEIVPRESMPLQRFIELLREIEVE